MTSPLWCANDEPHEAHSRRNEFNGTDYCTGRPSPLPTDEDREALAQTIRGHALMTHVFGKVDSHGLADAVLAWMEREGFRRSVVSTPEQVPAHERDRDGICRNCGQGITALEVLDGPTKCEAVSAPPTITDEERIAACEKWLDSVRGRVLGPLEGFNGGWAAAVAALGGEA